MGVLVSKFGGSSLADAAQFRKVMAIIRENPDRRYIVPSAPGKRNGGDTKVTDMLYALERSGGRDEAIVDALSERFGGIVSDLGLELDIETPLNEVVKNILDGASADYAASRGEYLNGLILAAALGVDFVDPVGLILFDAHGVFDADATQCALSEALKQHERAVIPGFYGSMPDGAVKTFSRGGSDITGAIVARAADAEVYENWTDVSGFLMTDPRIVDNPNPIQSITYRELRELSYMGAGVLHEDAIFPVRIAGIPIKILNTNAPAEPGTTISNFIIGEAKGAITGIAGRKGISAIAIEKAMMNAELGFGRRVLEALEHLDISFEHLPTGIDTMTVVVSDINLKGKERAVVEAIREASHPDSVELVTGLSLIAIVGRGMVRYPGSSAAVFQALAGAGVNVRMIDQGSSEINIIVAVDTEDFEKAVRAIYARFVKG